MKLRAFPLCLIVVLSPSPALAGPVVVGAGQTYTLDEDLVLKGDDLLDVQGTPEKPCILVGNRHGIRSDGKWTGSLKIAYCTIRDLGGLPRRAADGLVK